MGGMVRVTFAQIMSSEGCKLTNMRKNDTWFFRTQHKRKAERDGLRQTQTHTNPNASVETFREKLDTPVVDKCDVLIVGGGPAGISAALAAARTSTKESPIDVLILER